MFSRNSTFLTNCLLNIYLTVLTFCIDSDNMLHRSVSSYQEPAKYSITSSAIWSPVLDIVNATVLRVCVQEVSRSSDGSRPVLTSFSMEQ